MKKNPAYTLSIISILMAVWVIITEQLHLASNTCGTTLLIYTSISLAIVSIIRNLRAPADAGLDAKPLWDAIAKLRVEIEFLRKQIRIQENLPKDPALTKDDSHPGVAVPTPLKSVLVQPSRPTPEFRSPRPTYPVIPELPKAAELDPAALPVVVPPESGIESLPQPEIPFIPEILLLPPPLPMPEPTVSPLVQPEVIEEPLTPVLARAEEPVAAERAPEPEPVVVPEAFIPESVAPSQPQGVPLPGPTSLQPPSPLPARPAFKPMYQQPVPPELAEKPRRNMEDFLGTQLFLKAGVAILVIGVVFAMGLVFQRMGPLGKILMGYLGALAMLGGGLFAERKPTYMTFGRAIIAGAWGILYFVTYAGGFIEASKVFPNESVAIIALLVAAAAAVAFSLRYRNEWTTTSAFLLIFLGLGTAAWELQPTFNLTSTLIVALAMAVLVWRTGWVRLLGFGVPATWGTLTFWIIRRPSLAADASLLITLLVCWAAFQLVLVFFDGDEDRERWIGLSQIGNFLGGFGLCLHQTLHGGRPWIWAAGFGLANLLVAWAYHHRGRRTMYLLAATEAFAALALVTPLRLGWKHFLTPIYRLIGIEMLLVGGIVLKEKYFRRIAYGAFCFTLLDILITKLDPSLGLGRTLLLGTASGLWLLNAGLLRTFWKETCEETREIPIAPYAFSAAGTLLLGILIWFEVPVRNLGSTYAILAILWLALGWLKGHRDTLAEAPILGFAALGSAIYALVSLPGEPGTVTARWAGAAGTALLLGAGSALTRRKAHENVPEDLAPSITALFGYLSVIATWAVLFRELPTPWVATGFGVLAVALMGIAAMGKYKDVATSAFFTLASSLLILLLRPVSLGPPVWHVTLHGWSLLSVSASAFAIEAIVRYAHEETFLSESAWTAARRFGALSGFLLLLIAAYTELPLVWKATGFAALAVVYFGIALWRGHKDRAIGALFLFGFALVLLYTEPAPATPGLLHISQHGWSLLGVGSMAFVLECLIRRPASEPLFSKSLRTWAIYAVNIPGLLLGCLALYREAPTPWIAVSFGAAAISYLLLGIRWSHKDRAYEAYLLLLFGIITLIMKPAIAQAGWLHLGIRSWTFIGLGTTAFILEFISRRESARGVLGDAWRQVPILFTSLTGLVLAVLVLFIEVPDAWLAVTISGLAMLHLGLGMLWSHRDRALTSFGLMVMAMALLWIKPASTTVLWGHITAHGWTLLGVALAAFLSEAMIRIPAAERVLNERERQGALWFHFLSGLALTVCAIWTEVPDPWVAPALAFLSMLLLVIGLLLGFKEQVRGSILVGVVSLIALREFGFQAHGTWFHIEHRAWNLGILAVLALAQEWTLGAWTAATQKLDVQTVKAGTIFNSFVGVGLLILLAVFEFKPLWVPGSLMAFGLLWMVWACKRPSALHGAEALIFAMASLSVVVAMMARIWVVPGQIQGFSERILAVCLALILAYILHREIHGAVVEEKKGDPQLRDLIPGLERYGSILLFATTSILAIFIKTEAFEHHRDQLVPILWGALALAHFERGRALERPTWPLLGHALLGAGLIHVLLINLAMDQVTMGLSLRLWACLPFLGTLGLVYGLWDRFHLGVIEGDYEWLRSSYLYVAQFVLGAVLLYELRRPYVLTAWALQAALTLFIGAWKKDIHWLRAGLLLACASTLRAFAQNFYFWDAFVLGGENLVAIPVACAALLAGYVRLRLANPHAEAEGANGVQTELFSGWHRMPWFIMQAALLATFILYEATGTSLTVWATLFGFGMVGLGFAVRERLARLLGLGILSTCTLKLFIWDLRGLQGLPRVASFIALGVVLITVSFVYTRFKDRLESLL